MKLKNRIISKICNKDFREECNFPQKNLLIEITNLCNNKCVFCYNDCMKRKKTFIRKELCEKILLDAYSLGMREVGFYVTGEPLLDERIYYFVKFAKNIGYEYIYLTTNGILANLKNVKKLYNSGLNSIKYSINATNACDYRLIHGTDNFNIVIKNLSEVYNWKKNNSIRMSIFVSYVSIDKTRNLRKIRKLFSSICDEYVIMPAINQGGLIPDINRISTKKSGDLNNNLKIPCPYPFNSVIVTVEGYLTACCMDFENYLAYADLNKVPLEQAWNNDIIKKFREKHLNKNIDNTICQNCIYNCNSVPVPLNNELCKIKEQDANIFCKSLKKFESGVVDGSN